MLTFGKTAMLGAALLLGAAWSYGAPPQPWIGHQQVTVSGNQLLKDGVAWKPQGFNIFATIAPTCCIDNSHQQGYNNYGPAELTALRNTWDSDVLRYQISLPALAPDSPMYNLDNYIGIMEQRIADARADGFVVIISMNAISSSGWGQFAAEPDLTFLRQPDVRAQQVWHWLAGLYKNDLGVMFELFNEQNNENPSTDGQPSAPGNAWWIWSIVNQPLVNTIRAAGAHNVIIAEGLDAAHYLQNLPPLNDPVSGTIYAAHTYPVLVNNPSSGYINFVVSGDMQTNWGYLTTTYPVIITEWYTGSAFDCWDSTTSPPAPDVSPNIVKTFLDYINSQNIGLVAFNFDTTPRYATNTNWNVPTQMQSPFACNLNPANGGPGQSVFNYFTAGTPP